MKTIFEKISDREIPALIVYENETTIAFLDIAPISKGHIVVTTKKPYQNIYDIPEQALGELLNTVKKVSIACKKVFQADGINIINNNEPAANQTVMHIHFHVIPRYIGDKVGFDFPHNEVSDDAKKEWYELLRSNIV